MKDVLLGDIKMVEDKIKWTEYAIDTHDHDNMCNCTPLYEELTELQTKKKELYQELKEEVEINNALNK